MRLCLICCMATSSILPLTLHSDFALTEVVCSSGNGSITSSDLLAKCLPCILSAIQSNLGLAYVLSGESSFTCSQVKWEILGKERQG